jgi:hypothetical protein
VYDTHRIVTVLGRLLDPAEHRSGDVRAGGDGALGTDLDPDHERTRRDDRVQRGVRTAPAGLFADPGDESPFLETFHQLGSGHLGQTRQLAELSTRQRPLVQQQLERGPVVDGPQESRGTRKAG